MSTLKVNTVQHNTSGFNNVVQFTDGGGTENGTLCRAWVNFNGTGTVAIRADFNVNSITDNSTGNYTANFSNAMTDANYSFSVMSSVGTAGYVGNQWILNDVGASITASSLNVIAGYRQTSTGTGAGVDSPAVAIAIFR